MNGEEEASLSTRSRAITAPMIEVPAPTAGVSPGSDRRISVARDVTLHDVFCKYGPTGTGALIKGVMHDSSVKSIKEQACEAWDIDSDVHTLVCGTTYLDDMRTMGDYADLDVWEKGMILAGRGDLTVDLVLENGPTDIHVSVRADSLVRDVKAVLCGRYHVAMDALVLWLEGGTLLKNDEPLIVYNINSGARLVLTTVTKRNRIRVRTLTLKGKTTSVSVTTDLSIGELKLKLCHGLNVHPGDKEVVSGKVVLNDMFTLAHYNPPDGEFVVSVVRPARALVVTVAHPNGTTYRVDGLTPADRVLQLKEAVGTLSRTPPQSQMLLTADGGCLSVDDLTLAQFGLVNGTHAVDLVVTDGAVLPDPDAEPPTRYRIVVENIEGEGTDVWVYPDQTVRDIYEVYGRLADVPPTSFVLTKDNVPVPLATGPEGGEVLAKARDVGVEEGVRLVAAIPPPLHKALHGSVGLESDNESSYSIGTLASSFSQAFLAANIVNMRKLYSSPQAAGPMSPGALRVMSQSPAFSAVSTAAFTEGGTPKATAAYQVYVRHGPGKVLELEFESPGTTVFAVKGMVEELWGVCPMEQVLVYKGESLEDHRSLRSYGVPGGASLYMALVEEEEEPDLNVAVETLQGKRMYVSLCSSDAVEKLRRKVLGQQVVPDIEVLCARFFFNGDYLEDHRSMEEQEVHNGAIILMVRPHHVEDGVGGDDPDGTGSPAGKLQTGIQKNISNFLDNMGRTARKDAERITVVVRNRMGKHLKIPDVHPTDTVASLKFKIAGEWHVKEKEQRLYLKEFCLRNDTKLCDAGVGHMGLLRLATVRPSAVGMSILVQTVSGRQVRVFVDGNCAPEDVIAAVAAEITPAASVCGSVSRSMTPVAPPALLAGPEGEGGEPALFFNGQFLVPGRPLSEYGVRTDSKLIQTVRAAPFQYVR